MSFVDVVADILGTAPNSPVNDIIAGLTYLVVVVVIVSCFFGALFSLFK